MAVRFLPTSARAVRIGCFTGSARNTQLDASAKARAGLSRARSSAPGQRATSESTCHCRSGKGLTTRKTCGGKSAMNRRAASLRSRRPMRLRSSGSSFQRST